MQFPFHPGNLLACRRGCSSACHLFGCDQLAVRRGSAYRSREHKRKIVLTDHQICRFDLPNGVHLPQDIEHLHRAGRIFQHLGYLGADAFQQTEPANDGL